MVQKIPTNQHTVTRLRLSAFVSFEFGLQLLKHIGIQDDERRLASTRYRIDTFRYRTRYRIDTKIMVSTRRSARLSFPDFFTLLRQSRYVFFFNCYFNDSLFFLIFLLMLSLP